MKVEDNNATVGSHEVNKKIAFIVHAIKKMHQLFS
jgi:hypothetical protein